MKPTAPKVCADPLPDDLVGIAEAARLLRLSPSSMWRRVRDGLIRAWRAGQRWKVSRAEVLELLTANRVRPEVQARADRAAELAEVDRELRAAGIRR